MLMRLLISVRNAAEAEAALSGGAEIVDAKEPLNGALGPVAPHALGAIVAAVAGRAPVSAALGDAGVDDLARQTPAFASSGIAFLKIGFAGMPDAKQAEEVAAHCLAVARPAAVILVGYADYQHAQAPSPDQIISIVKRTSAAGILLDTYDKRGGGLTALTTAAALQAFVARAKARGHIVALAGKLTAQDIAFVHDTGADIAGLRGAACDGSRAGAISAHRVRSLRTVLDRVRTEPAYAQGR